MHIIGEGLTFDDVLIVPVRSPVNSRKDVNTSTRITKNIGLAIPLGSVPMDTVTESSMAIAQAQAGGFGIIHRFLTIETQVNEVLKVKHAPVIAEDVISSSLSGDMLLKLKGEKPSIFANPTIDKDGRLICSAAVGLKDTLERSEALIKAGCDMLCLDIAHAHSDNFIKAIRSIKKEFEIDLIVGNVATGEAAEDLISAGADSIKVGIGPGSTCITRLVTGCGVPQLTAIAWVAEVCRPQNVIVVADGGIRSSGDMVKALAAGADVCACGGLFSGTDQAPSQIVIKDSKKFKLCRGMASSGAMKKRQDMEGGNGNTKEIAAEGAEILVPYKGNVHDVLKNLEAGIRSGFSYCGAHNIEELRKNARFIRVSHSTQAESAPHNEFWV